MTTSAASTAALFLSQATDFCNEILLRPDLLRHRLSVPPQHGETPLSSHSPSLSNLHRAIQALQQALLTSNPETQSRTLSSAEKFARLATTISSSTNSYIPASSSLLLALISNLRHQLKLSAIQILDVFIINPSSGRSELATSLWEQLFLPHLLAVLHWFKDHRSRILSSISLENHIDGSLSSGEIACENLLSRVSKEQAVELHQLEGIYEEVLDENTRAYAEYLKEILDNSDRSKRSVTVPDLVLPGIVRGFSVRVEERREKSKSEKEDTGIMGNGRYNVFSDEFHRKFCGGWIDCYTVALRTDCDTGIPGVKRFRLLPLNHTTHGRKTQPIWEESEKSNEIYSSSSSASSTRKSPNSSSYLQRVAPDLLRKPKSRSSKSYSDYESDLKGFLFSSGNSPCSSDSELESEEKNRKKTLFEMHREHQQEQPAESSCFQGSLMADSENGSATPKQTPPKDFVCPITSQIFIDPVTLETGQTYERKAIQEWLDRGNSTCPITRQKLQNTQLPKTNYVLKRLIATWKESNPGLISELKSLVLTPGMVAPTGRRTVNEPPKKSFRPSTSPTSVIIRATVDAEIQTAISHLCMSDILSESEAAVLKIEQSWRESNGEMDVQIMLAKPAVVNGFVEILFNSVDPSVLRATVYLLSELAVRDETVTMTLTRVDSDVDCIVALLKKGLVEASVLIYLLRPSLTTLVDVEVVKALLMVIGEKESGNTGTDEISVRQMAHPNMLLKPKTASVLLLGQIMRVAEDGILSAVARTVILEGAIGNLVGSLEADLVEERIAAVGILLRCIEEDGNCRNTIADKAELAPVLESFVGANDGERFEIVHFLSELVKLNRRTFNEQLLQIIKDEGAFSTMHTLLVFLQTALQDQCPVIASLLLQLDILAEPRKMSMYREEAIDALISCLQNSDFPGTQIAAAEAIVALHGRFSSSGMPLTRAFLLKRVGLDKSYRTALRTQKHGQAPGLSEENLEEEKAADEWERKMAFVLVGHEFGLLFEALAEGLKSRYAELSSACFVSAAWLTYMLTVLPDTGVRGAARHCLLQRFISILKSAKDIDDKALAMLALSSFMHDPEGLQDLTAHMKDVLKTLRELKRSSTLAGEMLKVLAKGQDSSTQDLWNHKELVQVDCSANGEVSSITCFKDRIFSGHSDGTLKVWSGRGSLLHLIQEAREHLKSITSLAILQSGEKLYSGSLDRTVRVWSVGTEDIHCLQVHDMKDQVHSLSVANTIACFVPQGAGVKAHSWNGSSKLLNPNKHVRCLSLVQGKLYCGCNDSSIQEIDMATGTSSTIQLGSRKLLGKTNPVYALQVCDGLLYSASSSLDGAAIKIWSTSNYSMVGSLASTAEVRSMVVSSELVYLGCKTGSVEIWSKEKLNRVGTLQTGSSAKVIAMAVDSNEEVLVIGTADGCIQAWGLT